MSSLAASPTQLLMTRMTFLVGFLALPTGEAGVVGASSRVASGAVASGSAGAVEAGFVACCSGSGSTGAYSYTTSFLGFSVGFSVEGSVVSSVGFSVGGSVVSSSFLVVSLPSWVWAESSSASLRVKASSGSGWPSPASSADPAASSSCVSVRSLSGIATSALFSLIRVSSLRVV